jgi:RNA polymerase sigma-70 factor (ECF subfamily)
VVADLALSVPVPAAVVAQAADGDVDALATIVGTHHDDMARIAYLITRDIDLAQDAVQAAWPVAWRKLGGLREPDRLRAWLMAITANEARQLVRRQRRHVITEIAVADIGTSQTDPGAQPGRIDLRTALARLSPDERALLSLRYVAGLDAGEIGRGLGLSSSGVRSRLSRLIAHLRTELDDA